MMLTDNMARKKLYGTKPNMLTLRAVTVSALGNVGRRAIGRQPVDVPGFGAYGKSLLQRSFEWLLGVRIAKTMDERLPKGWPVDVFRIVSQEIESKAGSIKLEDGLSIPAFYLTAKGAVVLPFSWIALVRANSKYSDYKKVAGLDDSIREALAQKGHKLTVRVMQFPLRVEIDRPDAETVSLADDWELLKAQPVNQFEYVTGTHYDNGALQIGVNNLCDPREFSGIVAGASGSGKSQWAMTMLLSAALNTSPELLSMVVCDPKNIDFGPFARLPHLAHDGLLTEVDECRAAIMALVAEMDRRTKVGDRSVMNKRILLYIDELPDLLSQDDGTIEAALVRLAQKGRAWGINVMVAAQKATSDIISTRALANLAVRTVLRVSSYHESSHVSGQDGCQAHKLPGNGSALIYNAEHSGGLRSQSHFVGNADAPDFDRVAGRFIDDIRDRWHGCRPHWRFVAHTAQAAQPALVESVSIELPDDTNDFDAAFIVAMSQLHSQDPGNFSINAIRKAGKEYYGAEPRHTRAKRLYELIAGA